MLADYYKNDSNIIFKAFQPYSQIISTSFPSYSQIIPRSHCTHMIPTSFIQTSQTSPRILQDYSNISRALIQQDLQTLQKYSYIIPTLFQVASNIIPRLFPYYSHTIPRSFLDYSQIIPKLIPHYPNIIHNWFTTYFTLFLPLSKCFPQYPNMNSHYLYTIHALLRE